MPDRRAIAVACLSLLLAGCGQAGEAPQEGSADGATTGAATASSSAPSTTDAPVAGGSRPAPARLVVPSVDLDERLIGLGLAPDGAMEVPEDPARAGWFTGGGRPGGPGPTVVAGHVDSTDGPAVFGDLTALSAGDEVHLEDAKGTRVTYRVDRATDYPKGTFPTEQVFGATADDELRLITCTGEWDSVASQYTDNRVVYASAVTE